MDYFPLRFQIGKPFAISLISFEFYLILRRFLIDTNRCVSELALKVYIIRTFQNKAYRSYI